MINPEQPLNAFELGRRVRWYINVRWLYLLSLSLPGIITEYIAQGLSAVVAKDIQVAIIGLAYNGAFVILSRFKRHSLNYQRTLAVLQVLTDVLLTTYLIYAHGGIEARTIIIYSIPIVMSGALFGRAAIYYVSATSAVLYDSVLLLDWFKLAPSKGILVPSQHADAGYLLTSILFYSASMIIIGTVADFVIRLLKTTEHQSAQKTLALGEAQQLAHLGSWSWDIKTDAITWSEEMYHIFGMTPGTVIDIDSYMARIHPEDVERVKHAFAQAISDQKPFVIEHRVVWPDQSVHRVSAQAQVELQEVGEPVMIRGIAQDITQSKQSEEALEKRTQELERLNNLMVGRELKMVELKQRIKELEKPDKPEV